jgi:hypothetical protein
VLEKTIVTVSRQAGWRHLSFLITDWRYGIFLVCQLLMPAQLEDVFIAGHVDEGTFNPQAMIKTELRGG